MRDTAATSTWPKRSSNQPLSLPPMPRSIAIVMLSWSLATSQKKFTPYKEVFLVNKLPRSPDRDSSWNGSSSLPGLSSNTSKLHHSGLASWKLMYALLLFLRSNVIHHLPKNQGCSCSKILMLPHSQGPTELTRLMKVSLQTSNYSNDFASQSSGNKHRDYY